MKPKQDYTDEEIRAILDEICGPLPAKKPKVVLICSGGRIVGDAVVVVSPRDPNWYRNHRGGNFDGEIKVRSLR